MDLLSLLKAFMPTSLKGWLIYALTILTTIGAIFAYDIAKSDEFRNYLLKIIDRNHLKAKFNESAFEKEAQEVLNTLNGQAVVIWVTDLSGITASKTVLYALDAENKKKITDSWVSKRAPIYATDQSRLDMTHLLEGSVVCGEFKAFSPVGHMIERETGGNYFCSVPVPPTVGHMIGILTVYFKEPPKFNTALRLELRRAAKGVVYD